MKTLELSGKIEKNGQHDVPLFTALVVDDDPGHRYLLRLLLEELGGIAHEIDDGEKAVPSFRRTRPDLVLMDMQMPGMNGIEAVRRLRALPDGAGIPIIMVTASPSEEAEPDSLAAGANAFLRKPLTPEKLWTRISELLHKGEKR